MKWREFWRYFKQYGATFLRESLLELLKEERLTMKKKTMIENALSLSLPEIVKTICVIHMRFSKAVGGITKYPHQ